MDNSLNASYRKLFEKVPFRVIDVSPSSAIYRIVNRVKHLCFFTYLDDALIMDNELRGNINFLNSLQGSVFLETCQNITETENFSFFKVKKGIEGIDSRINHNVIGIHIRRTDNKQSIRFSPTNLFYEAIDKELERNPNQSFYLATDDPKEEKSFILKYGERIISYKKGSLDRNNPNAIHDALIDLYHLSQCGKIFGSYYSSFSDVAALWGGIDKIVLKLEC